MYEYRATVIRTIDGDTLELKVDLGFQISIVMHVRLYGINAPELNHPGGQEAKAFVTKWVLDNADSTGRVLIRTYKNASGAERTEKYGRWLADVTGLGGHFLSIDLIATGHAVEYLP